MISVLTAATFSVAPLPDSELLQMRGGIALPGGINVAIAIQTDTRVDGTLLLRTIYRVDRSAPNIVVYAPEAAIGVASNTQTETSPASSPPATVTVMFDRQDGIRIGTNSAVAPAVTVSSIGQAGIGHAPANTTATELPGDGTAVQVPAGLLSLIHTPNRQRVHLQSDRLEVSHLVGTAIGSVISNTGSDRIIDTTTTIGLDISGATTANLGSPMLRIDTLVTDATAMLMPR
jgi:hypothetical protein